MGAKLFERNYFPDLTKEEGNTLVGVVGSSPGEANRFTFILYVSAITFAHNSLHMTNAYFVPDHQTVDALTDAAKSGVDVKILLAGTTDSSLAQYAGQYFYSELLKSVVKLSWRKNALLHAKTLVIDGVWSTVGSTNMDFWSFSINDEVNAGYSEPRVRYGNGKDVCRGSGGVRRDSMEEWRKRTSLSKIRAQLAHLLSRWL
jgi:cardiolipin synthase A/B